METYQNISGNSGISEYSLGVDHIVVKYNDGDVYLYNYLITGRDAVERMKSLALAGRGLSSFISRNVQKKYAKKYSVKN